MNNKPTIDSPSLPSDRRPIKTQIIKPFAQSRRPGVRSLISRSAALILLVLLPIIYFYPALAGEVSLAPGDGWTQNLGVRVLVGRMIAGGHLPLWNPLIFAGMPLLAGVYPGALYPPNWLFAVFSPGLAMNIVVMTTFHLALIGTYLYARRIDLNRIGALIAATAFGFGGFMIPHLGHTSRIAAAAWLPWILLAIERLHGRASWRWIAFGSAFIALQLFAGEPQMTFYTILVCGAYWLFSFIFRPMRQKRRRFATATAAMAVCGTLLSAVQLLPEQELLEQGERARIAYDYFSGYSFPPRQIFTFIFPYFFGGAAMPPYRSVWWGQWTIDETCGYVGLLTLLLGFVALFGRRNRSIVWFWAATAVISLCLAFGGYLPFELNHLLYRLPVYNLFRAPARHMFEFTFSLGILAGLGASSLARMDKGVSRRALATATAVMALIVIATAVTYRFFGDYLAAATPRPEISGSLLITDSVVPMATFTLTLLVVWVYLRRRSLLGEVMMILILIADLAAFGHFFNWRVATYSVDRRIADPPTVSYIKSREKDLNTFRIVSQSSEPFGRNSDLLDYPNASIVRGLQSVNGYDALRLARPAAIAGEMTLDGLIVDEESLADRHRGFDLLNVKYLLRERPGELDQTRVVRLGGVQFDNRPLDVTLRKGSSADLYPGGVIATELAVVSNLAESTHLPDGTAVARIRLIAGGGRVIERELQVGRDTSEWAYQRADVRPVIKHRSATVVESVPADGFQAQRYLARIGFERAEIERIEWTYLLDEAGLAIFRLSLYDASTNLSVPLDLTSLSPLRWRRLERFGQVDLFENTRFLPRAWFVREVRVALSAEVVGSIKTGQMKDGSTFDPAQTALLEKEDFGDREIVLPPVGETVGAKVTVTGYEPNAITLQTHNPQPGFLVLSEIYYRGWEAWIDGRRVPVERVNYTLRGLTVPPGDHRIEFVFRAHSFRKGAFYSAVGAILLAIMGIFTKGRRAVGRERNRPR